MTSPERRAGASSKPDPGLWSRGAICLQPLVFRRIPALWSALAFCAGAWSSRFVWQPAVVWIAASALLAGLCLLAVTRAVNTPWVRLAPLAALWMVVGLASVEIHPPPPTQRALQPFADGLSRMVRGRVIRMRLLPPRPIENNGDHDGYEEPEAAPNLSLDLGLEAIEEVTPDVSRMVPLSGGIRATVIAGRAVPTMRCGDTVEAPMRLRFPERYRDSGAWQYADYLHDQGIGAQAVLHADKLTVSPLTASPNDRGGRFANLHCTLYAAQAWAGARMIAYTHSRPNRLLPGVLRLSPDDAGMLNAMLFGDRAGLNHQLRVGFERSGSFHLFVVSGLHIGLVAFGLFAAFRLLRLPVWAATLLTLALTAGYAALTGFGIPVQRALWMASIFLVARLIDRERDTLNALGVAVLGVLAWAPQSLFEASFQMTFLAIVGVAGIAIPLGEQTILPYARAARHLDEVWRDVRFAPHLAQFRVVLRVLGEPFVRLAGRRARNLPAALVRVFLWGLELALLSIVTEMVMVLPMAVYFHRAALFALPANLLSLPLIGLLVPAALATFVAALLNPWAAFLPGALASLLLHGVAFAIGRISGAPIADLRVPAPAWWICLLVAVGFGFCCWASRKPRFAWCVVIVLPLCVAAVLWPEPPIAVAGMLEVTAIDVGQGDSILVTGPAGGTLLVDAGGPIGGPGQRTGAASTGFDVGEEVVAPYLWSRRLRRLDVVALTHEHSDHMGGMPAILRAFRPRELWLGVDVPSTAYAEMLQQAATLGIVVRHLHAGDTLALDQAHITVLAPEPSYRNPVAPKNDDSLVLRFDYGKASVLLEGDAEKSEERIMLDHARIAKVTLLKVGHHGSATSSGDLFLEAAAPARAVISVGRGNPFGHPRPEVVSRFAARGIRLYRTDMVGLTTFLLRPDGRIEESTPSSNP